MFVGKLKRKLVKKAKTGYTKNKVFQAVNGKEEKNESGKYFKLYARRSL